MGKKRLDFEDLELRKLALQLASSTNQPAATTTARAKELHKFLTSGKKIEDYRYAKDEANEKTAERVYDDEPVEESGGTVGESSGTVEPEAVSLSIYALAVEANEIAQRILLPDAIVAVGTDWRDAAYKLMRTVLDSRGNVIDTAGLVLNARQAALNDVIALRREYSLEPSDTVTVGQVIDAVNTLRARG